MQAFASATKIFAGVGGGWGDVVSQSHRRTFLSSYDLHFRCPVGRLIVRHR